MNIEDKQQFAGMISGYLKVMGRKADQDVLEIWWRTLARWGIDDVSKALQTAIDEGGNPIPATIINHLPDLYGHPSPEDAWNSAQKDEYSEGAYMSSQMLKAVCAASDSLERGDTIAARVCFLEVYREAVLEAKRNGEKAAFRYFPPIAKQYDEKLQIEAAATREARVRGWITKNQEIYTLERLEQLSGNVLADKRSGDAQLTQAGTSLKKIERRSN